VLARAVRASGRGGLTATLTVTYRRPVRLGVPLLATAEIGTTEGRRTTASARLVAEDDPGTALAEAEGLFVALRPERAADVFARTGRDITAWTARTGDA
jgi:acyl-CoA thioesterase FadM